MKSREILRSKIGPFSSACTDPYIGIGWEYQSIGYVHQDSSTDHQQLQHVQAYSNILDNPSPRNDPLPIDTIVELIASPICTIVEPKTIWNSLTLNFSHLIFWKLIETG